MVWISAGKGGTDGADHFLGRLRVLRGHMVDERRLREAQLGTEWTSVGMVARGSAGGLATVVQFVIRAS